MDYNDPIGDNSSVFSYDSYKYTYTLSGKEANLAKHIAVYLDSDQTWDEIVADVRKSNNQAGTEKKLLPVVTLIYYLVLVSMGIIKKQTVNISQKMTFQTVYVLTSTETKNDVQEQALKNHDVMTVHKNNISSPESHDNGLPPPLYGKPSRKKSLENQIVKTSNVEILSPQRQNAHSIPVQVPKLESNEIEIQQKEIPTIYLPSEISSEIKEKVINLDIKNYEKWQLELWECQIQRLYSIDYSKDLNEVLSKLNQLNVEQPSDLEKIKVINYDIFEVLRLIDLAEENLKRFEEIKEQSFVKSSSLNQALEMIVKDQREKNLKDKEMLSNCFQQCMDNALKNLQNKIDKVSKKINILQQTSKKTKKKKAKSSEKKRIEELNEKNLILQNGINLLTKKRIELEKQIMEIENETSDKLLELTNKKFDIEQERDKLNQIDNEKMEQLHKELDDLENKIKNQIKSHETKFDLINKNKKYKSNAVTKWIIDKIDNKLDEKMDLNIDEMKKLESEKVNKKNEIEKILQNQFNRNNEVSKKIKLINNDLAGVRKKKEPIADLSKNISMFYSDIEMKKINIEENEKDDEKKINELAEKLNNKKAKRRIKRSLERIEKQKVKKTNLDKLNKELEPLLLDYSILLEIKKNVLNCFSV